MAKPILSLDFDGVIHDYQRGWQGGAIYGVATPGFFAWAEQAAHLFTLVIHSSRSKTEHGRAEILTWLADQAHNHSADQLVGLFDIVAEKPPAFLTIDDRCIRFNGDWSDPDFEPTSLIRFKPWMSP